MSRLQSMLGALALALLPAALGCEDEDHGEPCSSAHAGGVIEGRLIAGDVPATAWITASDRTHDDTAFEVETDSAGAFHLDLPVGSYWLTADIDYPSEARRLYYAAAGPPYTFDARDSLEVTTGSAITADFLLGSLRIEVEFPTAVEGSGVRFIGYTANGDVDPQGCPRDFSFLGDTGIEDGRATIAVGGLAVGSHIVRLRIDTYDEVDQVTQELWLPAVRSCAEAETIQVTAGATTHYHAAIPSDPARITGSILGSWRELMSGRPVVTLVTPDSSAVVAVLPTRDDGTFEGNILVPEPVRALIEIRDTPRWYPRGSFQEAAVLELAPGVTLPPLVVEESGLILEISHPLHPPTWYVQVQLLSQEQTHVVATLWTSASPTSPFHVFSNLDPGDYWLRILPAHFLSETWRPQWYDRAADQEGATLVHVPAGGGVGRVDISLEDGGRIEGDVRYEVTPTTPAATVYLTEAGDSSALGRRPASEPQHYVATGLPDGGYRIGIWLGPVRAAPPQPPEDTLWYPETTDWNAAQVITITEAQVITGINFDLR